MNKRDEFCIWERLLYQVQKEIRDDTDGIARNASHIKIIQGTNEWLSKRLAENQAAEHLLKERVK